VLAEYGLILSLLLFSCLLGYNMMYLSMNITHEHSVLLVRIIRRKTVIVLIMVNGGTRVYALGRVAPRKEMVDVTQYRISKNQLIDGNRRRDDVKCRQQSVPLADPSGKKQEILTKRKRPERTGRIEIELCYRFMVVFSTTSVALLCLRLRLGFSYY
jgi:hypothetical protein